VWLLLLLGPLLIFQRALHREIQAVFLLITRRLEMKILGVPTGRVSLIPETIEGNRLRLGFVETSATDILRDTLIGMAPLLTGGLFGMDWPVEVLMSPSMGWRRHLRLQTFGCGSI